MELDQIIGPRSQADGVTDGPVRVSRQGGAVVNDAHGRYYESAARGQAFFMSGAALAGTAYVGGAAGTPLLVFHNPSNSGKMCVVTMVAAALRVGGSAANTTSLAAWTGASVLPTQATTTTPKNMLTQTTGGSVCTGWSNVALTSSSALNLALPLWSYQYAGTVAAIQSSPSMFDVGGLLIAAPGCEVAVGLTVIPTSMTIDIAMHWEEVPV